MFTGIIAKTGNIKEIKKTKDLSKFCVSTSLNLKGTKIGDSVAINGVCITLTKIGKNEFEFEAMKETLKLTNLKDLKKNSLVNLEKALTLNQALGGHLVQGHVDTEATVKSFSKTKGNSILEIEFPQEISDYLAYKGSITINGVSLTISNLQENTFSVCLIPHTLKNTNLKNLKKNDRVNLEVDLIARYTKRLLDKKENEAKYSFLRERNLI